MMAIKPSVQKPSAVKPVVFAIPKPLNEHRWQHNYNDNHPLNKTNYYSNGYPNQAHYNEGRIMISSQPQAGYAAQSPALQISHNPYQPQLNYTQIPNYSNLDYSASYGSPDLLQPVQPNQPQPQPQEPSKHYISEWIRDVRDNAHLQKTFAQIEHEAVDGTDQTSGAAGTSWSQPQPYRSHWNNHPQITLPESRDPRFNTFQQSSAHRPLQPQHHFQHNGAAGNAGNIPSSNIHYADESFRLRSNNITINIEPNFQTH